MARYLGNLSNYIKYGQLNKNVPNYKKCANCKNQCHWQFIKKLLFSVVSVVSFSRLFGHLILAKIRKKISAAAAAAAVVVVFND